jgi:hypothetical protein
MLVFLEWKSVEMMEWLFSTPIFWYYIPIDQVLFYNLTPRRSTVSAILPNNCQETYRSEHASLLRYKTGYVFKRPDFSLKESEVFVDQKEDLRTPHNLRW